jgi:hypothetical protein
MGVRVVTDIATQLVLTDAASKLSVFPEEASFWLFVDDDKMRFVLRSHVPGPTPLGLEPWAGARLVSLDTATRFALAEPETQILADLFPNDSPPWIQWVSETHVSVLWESNNGMVYSIGAFRELWRLRQETRQNG